MIIIERHEALKARAFVLTKTEKCEDHPSLIKVGQSEMHYVSIQKARSCSDRKHPFNRAWFGGGEETRTLNPIGRRILSPHCIPIPTHPHVLHDYITKPESTQRLKTRNLTHVLACAILILSYFGGTVGCRFCKGTWYCRKG